MNTFKKLMVIVFLINISECFSSEVKAIKCEYNFGNNSIIMGIGIINKTINIERKFNNLEYTYHIEDINNFNEAEDYVEISDKNEKKITYSLKCK